MQGSLFLEVDPRHILGIKKDHGAYFEEVIHHCGLETKNIVITMAVSSPYAKHYPALIAGLINYRVRGYKIALKFDYVAQEEQSFDLITQLTPNYVSLSARSIDQLRDNALADKLRHLNALVKIAGGQSILSQIDQQSFALLAENTGFNFVQGAYYENLAIKVAA